jgi:hypothetical protein
MNSDHLLIVSPEEYRASELAERLLYRACRIMHRRADRFEDRRRAMFDASRSNPDGIESDRYRELQARAREARRIAEHLSDLAGDIFAERDGWAT